MAKSEWLLALDINKLKNPHEMPVFYYPVSDSSRHNAKWVSAI